MGCCYHSRLRAPVSLTPQGDTTAYSLLSLCSGRLPPCGAVPCLAFSAWPHSQLGRHLEIITLFEQKTPGVAELEPTSLPNKLPSKTELTVPHHPQLTESQSQRQKQTGRCVCYVSVIHEERSPARAHASLCQAYARAGAAELRWPAQFGVESSPASGERAAQHAVFPRASRASIGSRAAACSVHATPRSAYSTVQTKNQDG
jgi:hypothetical protein